MPNFLFWMRDVPSVSFPFLLIPFDSFQFLQAPSARRCARIRSVDQTAQGLKILELHFKGWFS